MFLLFYCFIIILYKKLGLEFLIKLFLKAGLTTELLPKTAIPGRVFPNGGGGEWGDPHELYFPPHNSCVPHTVYVRSPHKVYVPLLSPPPLMLCPPALVPPHMRGDKSPSMCKRPREDPAESCQCSVDPVLSSHDAPYFETYLSSQAFFTFVTTLASLKVCFTLFLYPFPQQCEITYS